MNTLRKRLLRFDPIGNLLLITVVIMLLLALQWGGTKYAWSRKSDRRSPCGYRSHVNRLHHRAALSRQWGRDTPESGLPMDSGRQLLDGLLLLWSAASEKLFYPILVSSHKERDRHQVRY